MRERAEDKAKRYLIEGRVIITNVTGQRIRVIVRGDGELHHVEADRGFWTCTCPAKGRCSHQIAIGLVTATNRPAAA